ncbi:hypothetical protein SAMN05421823_110252 [Catalinimonas alkaloidigena]|uniref:Knr4/Smi1-like domain-containing protein n=1 Tax=Catalinimonas alkaloidigena TaxID=1075417 RepID=A0A1G9QPL6_9BACT|nr:SMI1/KNR4 family protein [Catalinimonas alkaloidigena]SDM12954.1 hypothetical protein SAMN05421823_110252 [Catalinimonas alkaloidigena]
MSLLKRFFDNKSSGKSNNLRKIEKRLNCKFPKHFHELLQDINTHEIILELADENYRILYSIFQKSTDSYENVVELSEDISSRRELNNGSIKLPFARNLSGDQFKFLFFEGKAGEECEARVFFSDIDSRIGQLEITHVVDLFEGKPEHNALGKVTINCKPQSIQSLVQNFDLPNPISYWKDSFGLYAGESQKKNSPKLTIESYATNYKFKAPQQNIAKFEIQASMGVKEAMFYTSAAYQIDNSQLQVSLLYPQEYRIFYFKLLCIVDTLLRSMQAITNQSLMTEEDFIGLINLDYLIQVANQSFRGVNYWEE